MFTLGVGRRSTNTLARDWNQRDTSILLIWETCLAPPPHRRTHRRVGGLSPVIWRRSPCCRVSSSTGRRRRQPAYPHRPQRIVEKRRVRRGFWSVSPVFEKMSRTYVRDFAVRCVRGIVPRPLPSACQVCGTIGCLRPAKRRGRDCGERSSRTSSGRSSRYHVYTYYRVLRGLASNT